MADKFMVGVYGFIFVSFIVSIVLLKLQRERLYHVAESFYRYAEWMVRKPTIFDKTCSSNPYFNRSESEENGIHLEFCPETQVHRAPFLIQR